MGLPTARDVPRMRADLTAWWSTRDAVLLTASMMQTGLDEARQVADRHRRTVESAEMYFVSSEMTELARRIGTGLETFAVSIADDLPAEHGLLVWGHRPVDQPLDEVDGAPLAITWSATGGGINVGLYDHLPTADAATRAVFTRQADPTALGDLAHLWETRMRADGKERPWAAVEDADDSQHVLRTLLATWLLLRQPVARRGSVHESTEVTPSKAGRKQLARRGADPTRAVRYVTLRQPPRTPEDTDTSASNDGAQRVYHHRWFVRPHRVDQYYPSTDEHQRIWRGPYLVTPPGTEHAPILGADRVHVLRR